jgi:hypothetical protein
MELASNGLRDFSISPLRRKPLNSGRFSRRLTFISFSSVELTYGFVGGLGVPLARHDPCPPPIAIVQAIVEGEFGNRLIADYLDQLLYGPRPPIAPHTQLAWRDALDLLGGSFVFNEQL